MRLSRFFLATMVLNLVVGSMLWAKSGVITGHRTT